MDETAPSGRVSIAPLTLAVAAGVVVVDQLTKWWAVSTLDDGDIDIVWTLRLNLSYNTGAAFGSGQSWGPVIAVVAMVIVVGLLVSLRRGASRIADVATGMIVGGAIGNIIDRLFRSPRWLRGGVVDFVDLQWFPIFNVADMGITIGGALLVVSSWLLGSHASRPA
jgi:signal peptidase II